MGTKWPWCEAHRHLAPTLRINGFIAPLPPTPLPCTPALPKFDKCQYLGFMYECASKHF